jgi:DNA-binding response OmpR family regulator
MNGFDVCNSVKREHGLTDVFVIMLTAKGQEYDRERGANVGANVYITKPFDPDALLKMVEEELGL